VTFDDVIRHGNITTRTVDSIRDAFQISSRVFQPKIIDTLEQAHSIASRLEHSERHDQGSALVSRHKSSDRLTDRDEDDKIRLGNLLKDARCILTAPWFARRLTTRRESL
jgi:hypothetical protein